MANRKKPVTVSQSSKKTAPQRTRENVELLLEIGTEELPHQFIPHALQQLGQSAERLLKDHRLSHGRIRTIGTPRRLALAVESLSAQQTASVTETIGPPKMASFDNAGRPTKAAMGFAASQGIAIEDLQIRQTPKGEYVCAVKREAGQPARIVLETILPLLIQSLSFPKSMRWNETGVRFARPIRWLVALCQGRTLNVEVAGIKAGKHTTGHRFLGGKAQISFQGVPVNSFSDYLAKLERRLVIPDPQRRRNMVVAQLDRLAKSVQGQTDQDEELLEEAVHSVEYPQAILGSFDPGYLSLPSDILKTSMKEHQGFFSLSRGDGSLLPQFISVTNMKLPSMRLIREGNERVLAARLADAKFFFTEDRKLKIEERVELLKGMIFHHKLGTLHQKTGRIMALAAKIADLLGDLDLLETVKRAAQLSKADLLTGMVGEFPTLQGVMGAEYARLDGEPSGVSLAIREQYLPRAMDGPLPTTLAGKVLSLADRLDTIVAFFYVGVVPTGSEDPLGLRRHASAVVRILVEGDVRLDLHDIVSHARKNVEIQGFQPMAPAKDQSVSPRLLDPTEFIIDRMRHYGRTLHGFRDDVLDAILKRQTDQPLDLRDALSRMNALQSMTKRPEFDPLMVGFKRAHRLTEKERWDQKGIDPSWFQHHTEKALYDNLQRAQSQLPHYLEHGEYLKVLNVLVEMKPVIDDFFTGVMVNTEDSRVRGNRLSLLQAVAGLFMSFADFSHILVQGSS